MSDQLEGKNPVLEALRSGRPINKILISDNIERHSSIAEILHLSKEKRITIEKVSPEIINAKSLTGSPQGVIAFTSAKRYLDIYDLLDISKARKEPAFYMILDGLEDPHNLGAILRTADAAGVQPANEPSRWIPRPAESPSFHRATPTHSGGRRACMGPPTTATPAATRTRPRPA